MIKDLARDAMAESTAKSPILTRAIISFNYNIIRPGENPLNNPDLRYTSFEYHIKYCPKLFHDKKRHFVINADIFSRGRLRFADYQDLLEQRKKNPALNWMLGFVDFSPEIIQLAKDHVDLPIKLKVDMVELKNKIVSKYIKEYGSLPDSSIFRDPVINKMETERFKSYLESKKKGASKVV